MTSRSVQTSNVSGKLPMQRELKNIENRASGLNVTKQKIGTNGQFTTRSSSTSNRRVPLGNLSSNIRIQTTNQVLKDGQISTNHPRCLKSSQTAVPVSVPSMPSFAIHEDVIGVVPEDDSAAKASCSQEVFAYHSAVLPSARPPITVLDLNEDHQNEESPAVKDMSVCFDSEGKENAAPCNTTQQSIGGGIANDDYFTSEYDNDIYAYLRKRELMNRPKPAYMRRQPDITDNMRSILVDWLVEVAEEYKLQPETLFLAVNYIDRFLSRMSVLRSKLQLVGTASMLIAAKFEEIYPPEIDEFVYITDDTYTKKQVLRMEQVILTVLTFDLSIPTIHYFLRRLCSTACLSARCKKLAMYLSELTLLDADQYLQFLPSIVAAAAVCLACFTLDCESWSDSMVQSSGYTVVNFRECLVSLHKSFCNAPHHSQQAVCQKYRSQKYSEVANIAPPTMLPI